jgi:hypothetical protein
MKSWKKELSDEFRSVATKFSPESRQIWRQGLKWLTSHKSGFGVVSWEPFFIGLLDEQEVFAGRALEAVINRKRLLKRLSLVTYDSEYTILTIKEARAEIKSHREKYPNIEDGDEFWDRVILSRRKGASAFNPEETLKLIADVIEKTTRSDWEVEGSRYLEHPGLLESGGLLSDAIIGETIGTDLGFSAILMSLLNQYQAEISVAILRNQGRLIVLPYSRLGTCSIGRMEAPVLSSVEAQFTNQVQLVEETAFHEFEELINARSLSERTIQEFFEAYPSFLCFGKYVELKSHPTLMFAEDSRRIPDFFLERYDGFSDILEIKLPDAGIVVGTDNRKYFSSAVYRGLAQLKEYAGYFDDQSRRSDFEHKTQTKLLNPNLVLLIGRNTDFGTLGARQYLQRSLERDVAILTYDDILESAKRRRVFVDRSTAQRVPPE